MKTVIRHMFTAIVLSLVISLITGSIIFSAFPLNDWIALIETKVYDVPLLVILLGVPVGIGMIGGLITGLYWRQRMTFVERRLDDIVKGHQLTHEVSPYKELDKVLKLTEDVQAKIRRQASHAQSLATERANEREKSLQEIVVQERSRLARELHDSVSQQMFAASMMMSAINESNPPKDPHVQHQLAMVEKMIHQSQLEMRALLMHLRPAALKGKTLQEGAIELLRELEQKVPIEIDWQIEDFSLDKGVEDHLFRILQEPISNTLRHAKATTFHCMLIEQDDMIILRVVDNGVGFDVEKVKANSYGLQNMRERALEIGGTCKIISLKNEGTRLEVKVPAFEREASNND